MVSFHVNAVLVAICIWTLVIHDVSTSTTSTSLPQTSAPLGCMHNGVSYSPGESFESNPCMHCYCTAAGKPACAIADCFVPPCADAVRDPKQCCAVCPNGPNCQASDGTIIKQGDVYHPDPQTSCSCPNRLGFGPSLALCIVIPTFTVQPITNQIVS